MGNYLSEAILAARVGEQLLSRLVQQPSGSAAYTAEVANVIERAEGRVDAALSTRFVVPVTATAFLEALSLDLAEWELYRRAQGGDVPAKVRQAYEDAVADLKAIAAGELSTGSTTAPTAAADSGGLVVDGTTSAFDADSMEDADW